MFNLLSWAQQPTTVAGISTALGTASALLLGQMSWAHALPVLVGCLASMLLPDRANAPASAASPGPAPVAPSANT